MKRRIFLATLPTFVSVAVLGNGNNETVKIKTSAICGMCKNRIEKAFNALKGVESATLDLDSNIVTVVFNTLNISLTDLKGTLTKIGYDADELKASKEGFDKLPNCCKKMD